MTEPSIASRLASALADLHTEIASRPDDALGALSRCALAVVPAAEHAGVVQAAGKELAIVAGAGEDVERFAALQTELASGPSVTAIGGCGVVRSDDLDRDERWPGLRLCAPDNAGIRSALAVRLPVEDGEPVTVLTVLAGAPAAFGEAAALAALAVATCAALAISGARRARRIDNLERALETNRDIGTAIGVLMALHRTTREQAFELLRGASQTTHRKISEIARDVAETGSLGLP